MTVCVGEKLESCLSVHGIEDIVEATEVRTEFHRDHRIGGEKPDRCQMAGISRILEKVLAEK